MKIITNLKNKWNNHFAEKDVFDGGSSHNDSMFGIFTGRFHYIKRFIVPLLSPHIKKMQLAVNEHYNKTLSTNSKIFKKIIAEMEELDQDIPIPNSPLPWNLNGYSATKTMGFSRKEFYIFCMKFMVVLYDFDTHYMERGDYVIRRLLEEQKKLYIDAQSNPENWYPNRKQPIYCKYLLLRNREVKQP